MDIVAGRFYRDGFLLPGKYAVGNKYFNSVKNGRGVKASPSNDTEFLVVDPSCTTMWIAYNTAGNHPLPNGAIEAVYIQDGTMVYFVRMWIQRFSEYSYGYHDIKMGYGYTNLFGVRAGKVFYILCIV